MRRAPPLPARQRTPRRPPRHARGRRCRTTSSAARCHGTPLRCPSTAAPIASPRTRSVCSSRESCSASTSGARQPWSSHASADSTNVCVSTPTRPSLVGVASGKADRHAERAVEPHAVVCGQAPPEPRRPTAGRRCASERTASAPSTRSISVIASIRSAFRVGSSHSDSESS